MPLYYLGLGSNVEDRMAYIIRALDLLGEYGSIRKVSTLYISKPWGKTDQSEFINGVLEFETNIEPIEFLNVLKTVEKRTGRKPRERWGPREIDLDILLCENRILMLSFLRIPHPYLTERDFFLFPLLELNPNLAHPIHKVKLEAYAKKLENRLLPFACILPL